MVSAEGLASDSGWLSAVGEGLHSMTHPGGPHLGSERQEDTPDRKDWIASSKQAHPSSAPVGNNTSNN